MKYSHIDTPIGLLRLLANEHGLSQVAMLDQPEDPPGNCSRDDSALRPYAEQLQAYFAGDLRDFDLPLAPQLSPFQAQVIEQLKSIPFGQTRSYGELAQILGRAKGARAVGNACGRNPLPIVIPCHRVVAGNGALTGFAGGLERKRWLLQHEGLAL